MKKRVFIVLLLFLGVVARAQEPQKGRIALKTNVAELAVGVANLGAEFSIGNHFSVDVPFAYSPYTISPDWKLKVLMLQPEFRYWLNKPMSGHFFGAHGHIGYFNVAIKSDTRYQNTNETPLWGFGLSYGYNLNLNEHFAFEFTLGAGYASLNYNEFYNIDNGAMYSSEKKDYWGVTRVGISFIYMF